MNMEDTNPVLLPLVQLLEHGVKVAIVTAAGYPYDPLRYEQRFAGLCVPVCACVHNHARANLSLHLC